MEDLDYTKLVGQLIHVEGPKLARYFNADGISSSRKSLTSNRRDRMRISP